MIEREQEFIPALIILDGRNKPFDSYLSVEEVERVGACGGLPNAERIILHEIPGKPIPESLTHGEAMIKDIWIVLAKGEAYKE